MDDAEHVMVSMGSLASECTIAADSLRTGLACRGDRRSLL